MPKSLAFYRIFSLNVSKLVLIKSVFGSGVESSCWFCIISVRSDGNVIRPSRSCWENKDMLSVKKWNRSEISADKNLLRFENWSWKFIVSFGGWSSFIWGRRPGFG